VIFRLHGTLLHCRKVIFFVLIELHCTAEKKILRLHGSIGLQLRQRQGAPLAPMIENEAKIDEKVEGKDDG